MPQAHLRIASQKMGEMSAMWNIVCKVRILLSPRDKWRLIGVVLLMVLGALLEILGVGLLMPIIALFTKPELLEQNFYLRVFRSFAGAPGTISFACVAAALVAAVWCAKGGLSLYVIAMQRRFIRDKEYELNVRLFGVFLGADWRFLLTHGAADLGTQMQRVHTVCEDVLLPFMLVATDALTVGCLALMLLFFTPLITVGSALFLLAVGLAVYYPLRELNRNWGRLRADSEKRANRAMLEGFLGIKAIRSGGCADFFCAKFAGAMRDAVRGNARLFVLGQIPRHALELASALLALGIFVGMTAAGVASGTILLTFSLLVAALSRLLPAASRIHYNLSRLRQCTYVFDEVFAALRTAQEEEAPADPSEPPPTLRRGLSIRDLCFAYSPDRVIFSHFDLELPPLSCTAVTGVTGGGKSTLAELVAGILVPDSGVIAADGVDIRRHPAAWRGVVGYVPQEIFLADGTIGSNIAFGIPAEKIDRDRLEAAARTAQIGEFIHSLPDGFDTVLGSDGVRLSGGQRQRIGIARALYRKPELLILDEVTSALDVETERAFVAALEALRGKITMLVIAHRLSTVERCDQKIEI